MREEKLRPSKCSAILVEVAKPTQNSGCKAVCIYGKGQVEDSSRPLLCSRYRVPVRIRQGEETDMWYALQVRTGKEEEIACACRRVAAGDILEECFIPKAERMKRYEGQWHKEQIPMFPGYLFLVTEKIDQVHKKLKVIPDMTKILGDGNEFIPIHKEEEAFLRSIGNQDHLVEMSFGYLENGEVIIRSGPMKGLCGKVKKIDRHKRSAVVEVQMFGRMMDVKMGVEVLGER